MRSIPAARSSARASRKSCPEAVLRVLEPESEIWFPFRTLNSSLLNTVCGDCVDSSVKLLSEPFYKQFFGSLIASGLQSSITLQGITPWEQSTTCISTRIEPKKRLAGFRSAEIDAFDEKKSKCKTELRHFLYRHRWRYKELFAPKG